MRSFIVCCTVRYLPSLVLSVFSHGYTLYYLCQKSCEDIRSASAILAVQVTNYTNMAASKMADKMVDNGVTFLPNNIEEWREVEQDVRPCSCSVFIGQMPCASERTYCGLVDDRTVDLILSQNMIALQTVLLFSVASMSFVHRRQQLWRLSPFTNKKWLIIWINLLLCQVLSFVLDMTSANLASDNEVSTRHLGHVPLIVTVLTCLAPVVTLLVHELVKNREIRSWVRYQKRARLDFGTKLGMNSPF